MSSSILTRKQAASILQAVLDAPHPRLAKPSIAARHDLTVTELETLLQRHGYPNTQVVRTHIAQLLAEPTTVQPTAPAPSTEEATSVLRAALEASQPTADEPESTDDTTKATDEAPAADLVATAEKREPYIAALACSDLFVDHTYQRDLDQLRVARMAGAYDPALVGIVEVSQRTDGRYAILDGQHRWAAVRDVAFGSDQENPHLPCRVHTGLTIPEESSLYHRLNTTRKQLTGWDRWLARRGSGEQLVLDIERVVRDRGCTIGPGSGDNVIRATKACENVVDLGGLQLLDNALAVIRTAYRDDQNGLDASIIHGLGHVLHAYQSDVEIPRLIEALAGVMPRQLTARAGAVRELHKGTLDRLAGHVIVEIYNNSRGPRLEHFFSRVKPMTKTKLDADGRRRQAIREWATERGLLDTTVAKPRITRAVEEAYDAAHPGGAAR